MLARAYLERMDEPKHAVTAGVSREIRGLLGKNQKSQKDLGKLLDLTQGSISNRLRGEVPWSIDELDLVAGYFDVPIMDLFADLGISEIPCFDNSDDQLALALA